MVTVDSETHCWNWTGFLTNGYGKFNFNGKNTFAHRTAYELLVGPVADGLDLDHTCRNRACVNPAHLDPVTRSENIKRGLMQSTMSNPDTNPAVRLQQDGYRARRALAKLQVWSI